MTNYKIDMENNEPVAYCYNFSRSNKSWTIDSANKWHYGVLAGILIREKSLKTELLLELFKDFEYRILCYSEIKWKSVTY